MKQLKKFESFLTNEQAVITGESEFKPFKPVGEKTTSATPNFKKLLQYLAGKRFKFGDVIYEVPSIDTGGYVNDQQRWVIYLHPKEDLRGRTFTSDEIQKRTCVLQIYNKFDGQKNHWVMELRNMSLRRGEPGEDLETKYNSIWKKLSELCEQYKLADDFKKTNTKVDFE